MRISSFKKFFFVILMIQVQLVRADVCRILDKEKEALQCRIDVIGRAKSEILISTYIIREDDVGLGMLQLLIESVAKGVKVRLILDSFGKKIPDKLLDYLAEKGVEIHSFNNVRLFAWHTFFDRMHEKVLVTDTEHLIVGGRNLTKAYFKLEPTGNFIDREIYANSKKVAAELRTHFYTMWNRPKLTEKKPHRGLTDEERAFWQKRLADAWSSLREKTGASPDSKYDWSKATETTKIHATYDNFVERKNGRIEPSERKNRRGTNQLISLIDSAKFSIDIENPYFHPTKRWKTAFQNALNRGVKIRVLTNSECTNDVFLMQSVYRRSRPKYLKMGVQIWEYAGKEVLHTKSFIIDSTVAIVGSYNIHSVSEKNNAEVCLWVHDETIAAQSLTIMNRCLTSAQSIPAIKPNFSNKCFKKNVGCPQKRVKYYIYVHTIAFLMSGYL